MEIGKALKIISNMETVAYHDNYVFSDIEAEELDISVDELKQQRQDDYDALHMARLALEKQHKAYPNFVADGYADGELVYDTAYCPDCGHEFEEDSSNWGCSFCPDCAKALDWRGHK